MIFIGTSGWVYGWNLGGNLEWYIRNSGLNAVELNASFYRFPYPNQVKGWARKGSSLRWAVKVHRGITHYKRLNEKALMLWRKFHNLFKPLDHLVDFYLFQLPPSFIKNERNVEKLENFITETELGARFAVEFRHSSWIDEWTVNFLSKHSATLVSVDSPEITWIAKSNKLVYLRLHGRTDWYYHDYSMDELKEIAVKVLRMEPEKIYVFFNNNHWMLENARLMKNILEESISME